MTYVNIVGKSKEKAMEALRDLSVDMPEVCVMDKAIYSQLREAYPIERGGFIYEPSQSMMNLDDGILTLFRGTERVGHFNCDQVISGKTEMLGEEDFFFEWSKVPSKDQINELKDKIENALKPFDVKYTISNK